MYSRQIQTQIFDGVAFMTDLVAIFLEEHLANDPVPEVTILTFPVLHHIVHVPAR